MSIYSKDDSTKPDIPAPIITPTTLSAKTPLKTTVYSEISTGETIRLGTDNLIISEKGICWGETTNPTIATNKKG